MPIQIACPHCQAKLNAPDSLAGKKIKCPKCNKLGAVPKTPESPTTAWFVKLADGSDYGPVPRTELDEWFREGRITEDCQLLKDGSDQWQWATDVYPSLAPQPVTPATSPQKIPQRAPAAPQQMSQTAARTSTPQSRAPLDDLETLPAYVEPEPLTPLVGDFGLQPISALPALQPLPAATSNAVHSLPPAPNGVATIAPALDSNSYDQTVLQKVGWFVAILPLMFACMQMAPGWGIGDFVLPTALGFLILLPFGMLGGAMIGGRHFVPGAIAGFVSSLGGALALLTLLHNVNVLHRAVGALAVGIGALPGFGLFFILKFVQDLIFPPRRTA